MIPAGPMHSSYVNDSPTGSSSPDLLPDGRADLEGQSAARLDCSPVPVVTAVVERAEELPDEPSVRAVHLDAVHPAVLQVARGTGEIPNELRDLVRLERLRGLAVGRQDARRRPNRPPPVESESAGALSSACHELGEESRGIFLEGADELCEPRDVVRVVGRDSGREGGLAQRTRCELFREEQPDSAEGALAVEGLVAVAEEPVVAVLERRGGAHHPIRQGRGAELERLPEGIQLVVRQRLRHDGHIQGTAVSVKRRTDAPGTRVRG